MKKAILFSGFLLLGFAAPAAAPASPAALEFQFGFFHRHLHPYGEWIEIEPGSYVWRPSYVRSQWRPYLLGRWVWTDYGWYWVSSEPFGWVTYHYGRWYYDDFYGWVWVPDDVWGPSWVEWRYDDHYVGWAPLPPYATFRVSVGISFTRHWVAPVHYWNFVAVNNFGTEVRYRDILPERTTRRLIGTTRTVRDYEVRGDRVVNRGVDRGLFERAGNRRIERVDVVSRTDQQGERIVRPGANKRIERIEIYRPQERELRSAPDRFEARRGVRREPDATNRPQNLNRANPVVPQQPSNQPEQRDRRLDRQRPDSSPAPVPQLERPRREQSTPDKNERMEQRKQREMRRQLIERFDRQRPSPSRSREQAPSFRAQPSRPSAAPPAERRTRRRD